MPSDLSNTASASNELTGSLDALDCSLSAGLALPSHTYRFERVAARAQQLIEDAAGTVDRETPLKTFRNLDAGLTCLSEQLVECAGCGEEDILRSIEHVRRAVACRIADIVDPVCKRFRSGELRGETFIREFERFSTLQNRDAFGLYDDADYVFDRIFALAASEVGPPGVPYETGMNLYQHTPLRLVLGYVQDLGCQKQDILYDLGCGLGHVAFAFNVAAGIDSRGIEYQESYCEAARAAAQREKLDRVSIVRSDVRDADFSDGTIFYLFNPFTGSILQDTIQRIQRVSEDHPIAVCAPFCAGAFESCAWLNRADRGVRGDFPRPLFVSRGWKG